MYEILTTFAATEAHTTEEKQTVLEGLGIDFTLLAIQGVAFLLTVFVLAKWVYPVFMRIIDEREAKIAESAKAADEAKQAAEKAEKNVEAEMKKARVEATDIIATAKAEAAQMVEKAETDAIARSERIVEEAHEEIQKDVLAAKRALEKETLAFVKQAAGLAIANVADDKLDAAVIKKATQEASK